MRKRLPRAWPLVPLSAPATVAIWSGWVGVGEMTGFGPVNLLPGIGAGLELNTAITLPIGMETYAAYALRVWLSGEHHTEKTRRFARISAIASLVVGALGQVAYHLMHSLSITQAPWWITALIACLPVATLGMGAALAHLCHQDTLQARQEAGDELAEEHQAPGDELAGDETGESSNDDEPPSDDLLARAEKVIAEGAKDKVTIGRGRLALRLGITKHRARVVLDELAKRKQASAASA